MQGGRSMQKATSGNIGRKLAVLFVEQKNKSELVIDENGKSVIEQTSYIEKNIISLATIQACLLYTSPSPRDNLPSRMPSSA